MGRTRFMRIPIAREAWSVAAPVALLGVLLALIYPVSLALSLPMLGFLLYFFREPEGRAILSEDAVLSPAYGRVVGIERVYDDLHLRRWCNRVSIFLSLFDVHVNYAPVAGEVGCLRYRKGRFRNAAGWRVSLVNENNTIGIETGGLQIAVRQIAGLIARRIVCDCLMGDRLEAGQRIGLIRFGSRVDLFVPLDVKLCVEVGDRVRGGSTIIALRR